MCCSQAHAAHDVVSDRNDSAVYFSHSWLLTGCSGQLDKQRSAAAVHAEAHGRGCSCADNAI
jgi:hypothetical protein